MVGTCWPTSNSLNSWIDSMLGGPTHGKGPLKSCTQSLLRTGGWLLEIQWRFTTSMERYEVYVVTLGYRHQCYPHRCHQMARRTLARLDETRKRSWRLGRGNYTTSSRGSTILLSYETLWFLDKNQLLPVRTNHPQDPKPQYLPSLRPVHHHR